MTPPPALQLVGKVPGCRWLGLVALLLPIRMFDGGAGRRVVHRHDCRLCRGHGTLLELLPWRLLVATVVGAAVVVVAPVVGAPAVASVMERVSWLERLLLLPPLRLLLW